MEKEVKNQIKKTENFMTKMGREVMRRHAMTMVSQVYQQKHVHPKVKKAKKLGLLKKRGILIR